MVPTLADIRALGGLADRVQSQAPGKFLEIMKVIAGGGFGPQPGRFWLPYRWVKLDLYELRSAAHRYLIINGTQRILRFPLEFQSARSHLAVVQKAYDHDAANDVAESCGPNPVK